MKRIKTLDTLKGIGIILVVIGHSNIPKFISDFIYSFHMPLFFFLSGFTYAKSVKKSFFLFIKIKAQYLLVPYFSFGLLIFLVLFLLKKIPHINTVYSFFLLGDGFGFASWFLAHLFVLQVIMVPFLFIKKMNYLLIFSLLFLITGSISSYTNFSSFWHIEILGISGFFYIIGVIISNKIDEIMNYTPEGFQFFLLTIVSLIASSSSTYMHIINYEKHIDLNINFIGNPIIFLLASIFGILFCYCVAHIFDKYMNKDTVICYIGRNSLIILCIHQIIITLVKSTFEFLEISYTAAINRLCVIIIIWLSIYIINNYLFFLIGHRYRVVTKPY